MSAEGEAGNDLCLVGPFRDGTRRLGVALRFLVIGRTDRAVRLQRIEAPAIRLRLPCLRLRRRELLLRRLDREPVIGVVEDREDVALTHLLADVDLAAYDLAADAETLVDLVAGLHRAEVAVRFLGLVVADLHGAYGPQRLRWRLMRAAGQHRSDGYGEKRHGQRAFHDSSS